MQATFPPCFVHIGAPKTGTTLLQKVFFENRTILERRGLLYPDVSLRGYGHHDLAFLLAGGYPEWATSQPVPLEELTRELADTARVHRGALLISSEDFYLFPRPEQLHMLLANAEILDNRRPVIIVYVRRQDDAHESWYNQTIKAQGATHDFETSFELWRDLWDYRLQISRWAEVFGRDAIVVRSYERSSLVGGSLVEDIFAILGISTENVAVPEGPVNSSLNADLLEFQRLINQLPLQATEKRRFHHQLVELTARTLGTGLFDETPSIDPERRRAIMNGYDAGNSDVAAMYLGRKRLFEDRPPKAPARSAPPALTTEKLISIVAWLMARG